MNKKFVIIPLLVVSIALLITSVSAQTILDMNWDGTGAVDVNFDSADDASMGFHTNGGYISGNLYAKDYDNNPYGYGVDSFLTTTNAYVEGGFIEYAVNRTDSKTSYGAAGQKSYSFVGSTGNASMDYRVSTDYASMKACQYGFASSKNFEANGGYFEVLHTLTDSDDDGASVYVEGSGSAVIKLMGAQSAGSSFNMGHLGVCGDGEAWDDNYAKLQASGTGVFNVNAWADNSISIHEGGWTIPGDGTDNSAFYDLAIGYSGDLNYLDFGVAGN